MARLQDDYRKDVVPELMKKFGYKTMRQVPRIKKARADQLVREQAVRAPQAKQD